MRRIVEGKYLDREWEEIDEETEDNSAEFLFSRYRLAFGSDWQLRIKEEDVDDVSSGEG